MYECEICGEEACERNQDFCDECEAEIEADEFLLKLLEKQGHTPHCAARQVWGDGRCECSKNTKDRHDAGISVSYLQGGWQWTR